MSRFRSVHAVLGFLITLLNGWRSSGPKLNICQKLSRAWVVETRPAGRDMCTMNPRVDEGFLWHEPVNDIRAELKDSLSRSLPQPWRPERPRVLTEEDEGDGGSRCS